MKTKSAKKNETPRHWFIIDAKDKILGRLASRVASVLRGKHKVVFTPHTDTGDFVVVINAQKVKVTGRKETDKMYWRHSGWQGHIVGKNLAELRKDNPTRIVELAIKGMLPKGNLGRAMLSKVKIYAGSEHPHAAQKPDVLAL